MSVEIINLSHLFVVPHNSTVPVYHCLLVYAVHANECHVQLLMHNYSNISGKYHRYITRQSFPPFIVRVESCFYEHPLV